MYEIEEINQKLDDIERRLNALREELEKTLYRI